ncbi:niban-like protein 1 [Limosa lapponica baueri]|uniref:Niban-like protein 1 n=1 Tax=Limosa lapponica baueri TaxID=1758121 RepID=A0A2I0T1J4_LIMLA|nr:niban-like protein 1 [Limosa lapponica baueri]
MATTERYHTCSHLPQAREIEVPFEDHVIYSGNLFQYIEENKKWRNRFCVVPHNYGLVLYENKLAYERDLPPRILINSAGYKVLTSVDQYLELVNNSLPGVTPKSGHSPILKCPTDFPLILWHPYARHYYFCVMTGKEQDKWRAVFQDCVRHCNNGERCLGGHTWALRWGDHRLPAPERVLRTLWWVLGQRG